MEEKVQSNQNPSDVTEEKPKTVKKEAVKVKKQIKKKEREAIQELLADKPKGAVENEATKVAEKVEEKKTEVVTTEEKSDKQISADERRQIIQLLTGRVEED